MQSMQLHGQKFSRARVCLSFSMELLSPHVFCNSFGCLHFEVGAAANANHNLRTCLPPDQNGDPHLAVKPQHEPPAPNHL